MSAFEPEDDDCTCPVRTDWDSGYRYIAATIRNCPVHGLDPDEAYEAMREREMEDF